MNILPIMGLIKRLLYQRVNNGPEFVKNCKSDMAKDSLHLNNQGDFTSSIVLVIPRQSPDCPEKCQLQDLIAEKKIKSSQIALNLLSVFCHFSISKLLY